MEVSAIARFYTGGARAPAKPIECRRAGEADERLPPPCCVLELPPRFGRDAAVADAAGRGRAAEAVLHLPRGVGASGAEAPARHRAQRLNHRVPLLDGADDARGVVALLGDSTTSIYRRRRSSARVTMRLKPRRSSSGHRRRVASAQSRRGRSAAGPGLVTSRFMPRSRAATCNQAKGRRAGPRGRRRHAATFGTKGPTLWSRGEPPPSCQGRRRSAASKPGLTGLRRRTEPDAPRFRFRVR